MSEPVRHLDQLGDGSSVRATVVANQRLTAEGAEAEVRELVLEVDDPAFAPAIGQSLGVLAPGAAEFGKEHHLRLYSVADLPERSAEGRPRLKICVRRCSYIDDYSGERFPGVASNYLCDRQVGDAIRVSGPFGLAFELPPDLDADLILIGSGTGIAPFRAFVKHLHQNVPGWKGKIWLLYGARSGLELLYMNDQQDDFDQYYDLATFEAFRALSPRPHWADPIAWDYAIGARGDEIWTLLGRPKTYVYVAGLERTRDELDRLFAGLAGSMERWQRRKAELAAGRRWVELLY